MNDSTRRGLRTAYQTLIGLVTALPLVIFALPADVQVTPVVVGVGVWIAVVSKAVNSLEDAGFIPAWLKG